MVQNLLVHSLITAFVHSLCQNVYVLHHGMHATAALMDVPQVRVCLWLQHPEE